jgi:hypothetical protein
MLARQRVLKTDAGQLRSSRALELIGLPFDDQEEEWFEDALLHGSAKGLHGSKDTVMMRRLASGKLSGLAQELESLGGEKISWSSNGRPISSSARLLRSWPASVVCTNSMSCVR